GGEVLEAEAERAARLHHGHELVEGDLAAAAAAVDAGERARSGDEPRLLRGAAEAPAGPVAREPGGGGGARGGEVGGGGRLENRGSLGDGGWDRGPLAEDAREAELLGALVGAVELEDDGVAGAAQAQALEGDLGVGDRDQAAGGGRVL